MEDDTRAIIVGVGRITRRGGGFSLVEMISSAADAALLDASSSSSSSSAAAAALLASIDCVAVPGTFSSPSAGHLELDAALPGAVAARCGIANALTTRLLTSGCSGNAPQAFVSTLSAEIERGALRSALIAGGEALHSIHRGTVDASAWESEAQAAASGCGFGEAEACFGGGTDALFDMWSDLEQATGLGAITSCYALFETALRARCGRTLPEHARAMATFCAGLSDVAAAGAPHSWFDQVREPDELLGRDGAATKNRWVALPLRKMMCSMQSVDQSAALVLTSVGEARRLGIDASRWVYVRSGATVEEPRTLSHRPLDALHGSPAARTAFARALALASIHDRGPAVSALDAVDLYACFPVSAAIAARELGLDFDWRRDDGAKVSLLGGMMFHGGPGANTATHSIAAMVERLRGFPAGATSHGLVYAMGGVLSKHSCGVYSRAPPPRDAPRFTAHSATWECSVKAATVRVLGCGCAECCGVGAATRRDSAGKDVSPPPPRRGVVESFTVTFGRGGDPNACIALGRLDIVDAAAAEGAAAGAGGVAATRFLALSHDPALLRRLVGRSEGGVVVGGGGDAPMESFEDLIGAGVLIHSSRALDEPLTFTIVEDRSPRRSAL